MKLNIIEAHNGLSAVLVNNSHYDGVWVSSLTHSAAKGLPDNELVPLKERVDLVADINKITDKPIVVDVDTGGDMAHLPFVVKWFHKAGAYAIVMEDKKYPKQNSLLDVTQDLEDIDVFAEKIRIAKAAAPDLIVVARLESLIAKKSKYEALLRAEAYIEAGADGVMVHSKQKVDSTEVMEVGNAIREKHPNIILVAVPTTYTLPEKHPFNIVVTANQLLRASMRAMENFINGKDVELAEVKDIFNLLGH